MPSTLAPTFWRILRARVTAPRTVAPLSTTKTTPSTKVDRIIASVTGSTGGESITTNLKRLRNSLNIDSMAEEESSWAGLGGVGPAGIAQSVGTGGKSRSAVS